MKSCLSFENMVRLIYRVYKKVSKREYDRLLTIFHDYLEKCAWEDSELLHSRVIRMPVYKVKYTVRKIDQEAMNLAVATGHEIENDELFVKACLKHSFKKVKMQHQTRMVAVLRAKSKKKMQRTYFNFIEWRKSELPIANDLVTKLKDRNVSSKKIGQILAKITGLRLCDIVVYNDHGMTEGFLIHAHSTEYAFGFLRAYKILMNNYDLEHLKVIMNYTEFYCSFVKEVLDIVFHDILKNDKTTIGRKFLTDFFTLNVFHPNAIGYLESVLQSFTYGEIRIFLKYNLYESIKLRYGRDLMVCQFNNRQYDILSKLRHHEIDTDACSFYLKNTALHYAAASSNVKHVLMLLNKGADPNAKNANGQTPLFSAVAHGEPNREKFNCVRYILLSGVTRSSLLYVMNHQRTWEDNIWYRRIMNLIVADIAIHEARGKNMINYFTIDDAQLKVYYNKCKEQIERLKLIKICDIPNDYPQCKMTLHTIITQRLVVTARTMKEENLKPIMRYLRTNSEEIDHYYVAFINNLLGNLNAFYQYRRKAIQFLCKVSCINDPRHLVIDNIIAYLTIREVQNLAIVAEYMQIDDTSELEMFDLHRIKRVVSDLMSK